MTTIPPPFPLVKFTNLFVLLIHILLQFSYRLITPIGIRVEKSSPDSKLKSFKILYVSIEKVKSTNIGKIIISLKSCVKVRLDFQD